MYVIGLREARGVGTEGKGRQGKERVVGVLGWDEFHTSSFQKHRLNTRSSGVVSREMKVEEFFQLTL